MLLADQEAGRLFIGHHAGGVAVDAHLLFQARAEDLVALPRGSVGLGQELRHDEEADALHASRTALDPRQHEVDDVLDHVVFARADPDLLAADLVGAVGLGNRLGAEEAKVRAALRLCQVHRAAPRGRAHLRQVERLLLRRSAVVDGGVGPGGEARIHAEGHVGRGQHLLKRGGHDGGQALTAIFGIAHQIRPARLDHLLIGRLEARRGLHRVIRRPRAAFLVADAVQRGQHLLAELGALLEDLIDRINVGVLKAWQVGVGLKVQDVAQDEGVVTDGGAVGHGLSLSRGWGGGGLVKRKRAPERWVGAGTPLKPCRYYFTSVSVDPSSRARSTES